MGFYPVCPGTTQYVLGSPLFDEVILNFENGNKFRIVANDNLPENVYIQEVEIDGKRFSRNYLEHHDIRKGGILKFQMSNSPNTKRGIKLQDSPYSLTK